MSRHSILRIVAKFMIPYILLFGLYVQFHGDFGPGGGFQAGVIFAAAFILYSLIFGVQNGRKVLPAWVTRVLLAAGVLIYGGTGVASFFFDANFLSFNVLSSDPVAGQHLGIILVEFGVGVTVAATMITVFYVFAGQDHE